MVNPDAEVGTGGCMIHLLWEPEWEIEWEIEWEDVLSRREREREREEKM